MNSTTRYILTVTAVGVGLFTVGATANAIGGSGDSDPGPIGDPIILPSGPSLADDDSSLEVVNGPGAEDLEATQTQRRTRTRGEVEDDASVLDDDDAEDADDVTDEIEDDDAFEDD
ncbi:MAG: hypothetical protein JW722_07615 [Demequinaceae bacterium]|nr:hypothetical protein [Demequinaceae bacterium]